MLRNWKPISGRGESFPDGRKTSGVHGTLVSGVRPTIETLPLQKPFRGLEVAPAERLFHNIRHRDTVFDGDRVGDIVDDGVIDVLPDLRHRNRGNFDELLDEGERFVEVAVLHRRIFRERPERFEFDFRVDVAHFDPAVDRVDQRAPGALDFQFAPGQGVGAGDLDVGDPPVRRLEQQLDVVVTVAASVFI